MDKGHVVLWPVCGWPRVRDSKGPRFRWGEVSREICSVCFYRNLNFCLCQRDGAIVPEGGLLDTQRDVEKPRCCCELHEQRYGEECRCAGCGSRIQIGAVSGDISNHRTSTHAHLSPCGVRCPVRSGWQWHQDGCCDKGDRAGEHHVDRRRRMQDQGQHGQFRGRPMQSHRRHDVRRASQLADLVLPLFDPGTTSRSTCVLSTHQNHNQHYLCHSLQGDNGGKLYPLRSSYLSREKSDGCEDGRTVLR